MFGCRIDVNKLPRRIKILKVLTKKLVNQLHFIKIRVLLVFVVSVSDGYKIAR